MTSTLAINELIGFNLVVISTKNKLNKITYIIGIIIFIIFKHLFD